MRAYRRKSVRAQTFDLFSKKFEKGVDKRGALCYNTNVPKRYGHHRTRRWCGSMAEQLICNQQVAGSTPVTSSKGVHTVNSYMGDFPSGQRGQTVNLLLFSFGGPNPPSPTNKKSRQNACSFCCRGIVVRNTCTKRKHAKRDHTTILSAFRCAARSEAVVTKPPCSTH